MSDEKVPVPDVAPILATGMNDYTAELPMPIPELAPVRITFEKSNTRPATITVGTKAKRLQTMINGHLVDLPPGTISPRNIYSITENDSVYILDPDFDIVVEEEPVKFQVKYKDGGGEQIFGTSVDEVRAEREAFWGDREIASVEEIKPVAA